MLASFERKRGVSRPERTLAKNDWGEKKSGAGERKKEGRENVKGESRRGRKLYGAGVVEFAPGGLLLITLCSATHPIFAI